MLIFKGKGCFHPLIFNPCRVSFSKGNIPEGIFFLPIISIKNRFKFWRIKKAIGRFSQLEFDKILIIICKTYNEIRSLSKNVLVSYTIPNQTNTHTSYYFRMVWISVLHEHEGKLKNLFKWILRKDNLEYVEILFQGYNNVSIYHHKDFWLFIYLPIFLSIYLAILLAFWISVHLTNWKNMLLSL